MVEDEGLNIPEDIEKHIDDSQLKYEMVHSGPLLNSMVEAIQNVKECLDANDEIKAFVEGDERDVFQKNRIKVSLDIDDSEDNLEEWSQKKDEIKKAVRSAESEEIMIYTFVDRKRN